MICKGCGETYDEEMFPVCPFCLTENKKSEDKQIGNNANESDGNSDDIQSDVNIIDNDRGTFNKEETVTDAKDTSVKDINIVDINVLSMRSKNILRRNGIFKLSELKSFLDKHELRDINGLGASCEHEIRNALTMNNEITGEEKISPIKIEDVYSDNKYSIFVRYCADNSIKYMGDLDGFDFNGLSNIRGIGKGKIADIISQYEQYDSGNLWYNNDSESKESNSESTMFNFINEQLADLDISFLMSFGIKDKSIRNLTEKGYTKVRDIKNISTKTMRQIVGARNQEKFESVEKQLRKPFFELFEKFLYEQCEDEDFGIDIKKASGYTLQELGNEYGITRERIRQKIIKFNSKIDPFMVAIVELFMLPKNYITVQELLDIYDNDDFDKVIIYWCKNSDKLEYLDFADVFVYAKDGKNAVENQIVALAEEFIGEGIDLYDNLEELEDLMQNNGFSYVDGSSFINLVKKYGYKVYGDYIVKGKQSYGYLCSRIVAEKFPLGIKLYGGDDLDKLRKYSMEEYGDLGIPENDRAFSARLANYLILSGKGMVTAESNIHVEMMVLDEIKEYIDSVPEGQINYSELFSLFEGKLRMLSNIDNYNFLHGVLKLYYAEEYDFSNRDYLKKKGSGYKSGKLSVRIKNYIESVGHPVHKNEIKKKIPGLTDIVLVTTTLSDENLMQWDYNYYYLMSMLQISQEDKKDLCHAINNIICQNDGYCSDHLLYDEIVECKPEFLKNNRIKTVNNLFFICQKLFSQKYDFRRPHISKQGLLEEISVKNVALHLLNYPEKLSFNRYQEIANKLKWSPVTTGMVFGEIEKDYVRIADDLYIKKEHFDISNESVIKIQQVLKNKMLDGYVSLINFDDWEEMPSIQYEWNIFLLRTIIDIKIDDLRIVEIKTRDRRYERGIVIESDSEIKDYADLVISLLNKLDMTEITENNMLTSLIMNNLTYKMIPKELYVSDKIIYDNGRFAIRE